MSVSINVPSGDMAEKSPVQPSLGEVSNRSHLETADADESVDDVDGFTKYDQRDMRRMGKRQEFTVSLRLRH